MLMFDCGRAPTYDVEVVIVIVDVYVEADDDIAWVRGCVKELNIGVLIDVHGSLVAKFTGNGVEQRVTITSQSNESKKVLLCPPTAVDGDVSIPLLVFVIFPKLNNVYGTFVLIRQSPSVFYLLFIGFRSSINSFDNIKFSLFYLGKEPPRAF